MEKSFVNATGGWRPDGKSAVPRRLLHKEVGGMTKKDGPDVGHGRKVLFKGTGGGSR